MKNVICSDCGQKNFSANLYCEKCSGSIYKDYLENIYLEYLEYL
ncbi:MAG: hypothetical protein ACOCRK_02585 [bacterium]